MFLFYILMISVFMLSGSKVQQDQFVCTTLTFHRLSIHHYFPELFLLMFNQQTRFVQIATPFHSTTRCNFPLLIHEEIIHEQTSIDANSRTFELSKQNMTGPKINKDLPITHYDLRLVMVLVGIGFLPRKP